MPLKYSWIKTRIDLFPIWKILQLSVNNSTDESESSGDLKMDYNPRRNRIFPLAVPTYVPGMIHKCAKVLFIIL